MSNAENMVSVPRGLLMEAEASLRASGMAVTLASDIQKVLDQPSEQHQGEPVEALLLSDCIEHHHKGYGGGYFGTDIVMLYTHADTSEVERLSDRLKIMTRFRDEFEIKAERLEEENENLRSELSDAIQSLRTIRDLAGRDEFMRDIDDVRQYANSRSIAANYMLSTSQESIAPVERDERAEFDEWYSQYTAQGFEVSKFGTLAAWMARAALERKP